MTKAQERKVEMLRREVEKHCGSAMEVKRFEVHENEYFVSVVAEIGYPGDEGTIAEALCRRSAQVFIGKRGGMRVPVYRICKNGTFKSYYKKYTFFIAAHIDQNRR